MWRTNNRRKCFHIKDRNLWNHLIKMISWGLYSQVLLKQAYIEFKSGRHYQSTTFTSIAIWYSQSMCSSKYLDDKNSIGPNIKLSIKGVLQRSY